MVKNRIKEILDERGIRQNWLAEKSRIDRSTLTSVIANKKSTNLETGMLIAKALNLPVEDIFYLVEDDNVK